MMNLTKIFPNTIYAYVEGFKLTCNTIIMPEYFLPKIKQMCSGRNEKAGFLICSKQLSNDFICYIVEHVRVMEEGNPASVYPSKMIKMGLPNEFSAIEFHIHPKALGEFWQNKFSQGDYDTLSKRVSKDISYKHVLFTDTQILTFGNEKPDFLISKIQTGVLDIVIEKEKHWAQKENK